jgi:hypothetical protein
MDLRMDNVRLSDLLRADAAEAGIIKPILIG